MTETAIVASSLAFIQGRNSSYATARTTGIVGSGTYAGAIGQFYVSSNYYIYRLFIKFDTSSLFGETISDVKLRMTFSSVDYFNTDTDIMITKLDWSDYDPVTTGNRETLYNLAFAANEENSILVNTTGIAKQVPITSGSLSTDWINTSGNTYYGIITRRDYNGTTPTGREDGQFYLPNYVTEAWRPQLIVTHEAPVDPDILVAPLGRTLSVAAESRTYAIASEARTLTVGEAE